MPLIRARGFRQPPSAILPYAASLPGPLRRRDKSGVGWSKHDVVLGRAELREQPKDDVNV